MCFTNWYEQINKIIINYDPSSQQLKVIKRHLNGCELIILSDNKENNSHHLKQINT